MGAHGGPDDSRIKPRAVVGAQDADRGSVERQVDQGLVPDRLPLLRAGTARPGQLLKVADGPSGMGAGEGVHVGNDPAGIGANPGYVRPGHPVSAAAHARTQEADLRARRADKHGLVLIESRVDEPERPRQELIHAGVQERGMSGQRCAGLHEVTHRHPLRWLITLGSGPLPGLGRLIPDASRRQ